MLYNVEKCARTFFALLSSASNSQLTQVGDQKFTLFYLRCICAFYRQHLRFPAVAGRRGKKTIEVECKSEFWEGNNSSSPTVFFDGWRPLLSATLKIPFNNARTAAWHHGDDRRSIEFLCNLNSNPRLKLKWPPIFSIIISTANKWECEMKFTFKSGTYRLESP